MLDHLDPKILWLFVFIGLYWTYCLFWGIKGALSSRSAGDYMLAGRDLGIWVFGLAVTATAFTGWTFIGHPGLIYVDGFQYAFASFFAMYFVPFILVLAQILPLWAVFVCYFIMGLEFLEDSPTHLIIFDSFPVFA